MKRTVIFLLSLVFLLGCVPTPDEDIVANKAEGRLEDLIDTDAVEAYAPDGETRSLRSRLGAPESVKEALTDRIFGGTLHIDVDAEVEIPDVNAVPVLAVSHRRFSADEKERIVQSVLGDAPYYEFNRSIAERDDYNRLIERYQNIIEGIWNSPNGTQEEKQSWVTDMEAERNQFVRALQKLEVDESMHPWTGSFADEGVSPADANNSCVTVSDRFGVSYSTSGYEYISQYLPQHTIRTDAERQAAETALAYLHTRFDAVFEPMNISRMEDADGSDGQRFDQSHSTYVVELLPSYEGILCFPGFTEHGSDTAQQAAGYEADYTMDLPKERVEVYVRDGEVVYFNWENAMEVVRTENANVTLLPFPKIMELFRSHVFLNYYLDKIDGKESEETLRVRSIRLCYALLRKPDSDEFYLMPVWDFAMDSGWSEDGAWSYQTSCVLSINAVDGSVIDRQVGY